METSKWGHKLISWAVVMLIVAVTLHVVARLMVTALPTLIVLAFIGLIIWTAVVVIRRRGNQW